MRTSDAITIKFFTAAEDRVRSTRYLLEHIRVLDDIGVTSILKPDFSWCLDPNVIIGVAEHPELGMVGGIRIHLATGKQILPLHNIIGRIDPTQKARLESLNVHGNCEIAGLWNAHRYAGKGVYKLLISAAVALAGKLELSTMMCFAADYVAPTCRSTGFSEISTMGDNGQFAFPFPAVRSFAMIIKDLRTLDDASISERQRAVSLRLRPQQTRHEQPKQEILRVNYDILPLGGALEGSVHSRTIAVSAA
jgi:hypothetical protein